MESFGAGGKRCKCEEESLSRSSFSCLVALFSLRKSGRSKWLTGTRLALNSGKYIVLFLVFKQFDEGEGGRCVRGKALRTKRTPVTGLDPFGELSKRGGPSATYLLATADLIDSFCGLKILVTVNWALA